MTPTGSGHHRLLVLGVIAGWLVHRYGYGSAFVLAAGFMAVGVLVMLPVRLYRGTDRLPA